MAKEKTYRYDDAFKAKARAHQFAFREEVLNDYYDEKNPQVMLSPEAASRGLIFCDVYRESIRLKVGGFGASGMFSDMLRSEHIPYNVFVPMEEDLDHARLLFNEIIGGGIYRICGIRIEFAGYADKSCYLNDRTAFDAYVEYEDGNEQKGAIGIEVKYTEAGYPIGVKEKAAIENPDGVYSKVTSASGYYPDDFDIKMFVKANHLRQIWRNHILGYSMVGRGDLYHFHHIHLYPQGNIHFHQYAIPEYKRLLTHKGLDSFIDLTYERLLEMIRRYFTSEKQRNWVEYLYQRYLDM